VEPAAACEAEREARTKPLQPGTLKVVELAHLRGRRRRARPQLRRWRACYGGRARRHLGHLFQERDRRGRAFPGSCPVGRALHLVGHRLVRPRCRGGAMPRPAITARIGCLGQGPMRRPPAGHQGGRLVDGGADQWVAKAHAAAEFDQSCGFGWSRRVHGDLLPPGRTPQQASRHNRFGRCGKQQLLRVAQKHFQLQVKAVFNAASQWRCGGKPESAPPVRPVSARGATPAARAGYCGLQRRSGHAPARHQLAQPAGPRRPA
jgi:hypothetical protein